jgi:signal transduction histidine kinase
MSSLATPKLKAFARRLLIYEAAVGTRVGPDGSAAFRVCSKLRGPLAKLMGLDGLRPSVPDDLGLEPALRWYTSRQAALTGLKCEVQADPLERRLDPVIETTCFRVAQEALTNVARHARAHKVTVELRNGEGQLHLRVRDDGVGFQVTDVRAKAMLGTSLGLLRMEERAVLAGGQLEFNSAPSQGAEVHAWFPLKWQTVQA